MYCKWLPRIYGDADKIMRIKGPLVGVAKNARNFGRNDFPPSHSGDKQAAPREAALISSEVDSRLNRERRTDAGRTRLDEPAFCRRVASFSASRPVSGADNVGIVITHDASRGTARAPASS